LERAAPPPLPLPLALPLRPRAICCSAHRVSWSSNVNTACADSSVRLVDVVVVDAAVPSW
jgi:hypothetical protein